jgi:DNA-binding response OmpR family regulator
MRCLIVDDDAQSRESLVRLLLGEAACDCANDAAGALEKFRGALGEDRNYDLVILGIAAPAGSCRVLGRGIRGLEEAQGCVQRVKIIVLTSTGSVNEAMGLFLEIQSAACLVKPVSEYRLFRILADLGLKGGTGL